MLYWLAEWLGFPGVLNLIRYLSFRSGAAVATAVFVGMFVGSLAVLFALQALLGITVTE